MPLSSFTLFDLENNHQLSVIGFIYNKGSYHAKYEKKYTYIRIMFGREILLVIPIIILVIVIFASSL